MENKQEKQSFDILKELCSSSPQHIIPTKKHVTSITLVSNNFTASLRFLFKQLKAKVLCMFFLELGSVVPEFRHGWIRLLALKLQWWEFSPPPSPREIYRPLSKDWGFLTNIPTKLPAFGKARRFPGGTRYIFQCTSMSNTSNDAEDKGSSPCLLSTIFCLWIGPLDFHRIFWLQTISAIQWSFDVLLFSSLFCYELIHHAE